MSTADIEDVEPLPSLPSTLEELYEQYTVRTDVSAAVSTELENIITLPAVDPRVLTRVLVCIDKFCSLSS